jgi:alkanesulfonate monooxygenase SsuD/methylene tetrahydromethanopterin reductase-like flavin-dependent oxidoreductase (luciferase family)
MIVRRVVRWEFAGRFEVGEGGAESRPYDRSQRGIPVLDALVEGRVRDFAYRLADGIMQGKRR